MLWMMAKTVQVIFNTIDQIDIPRLSFYPRGWSPKFATGLNVIVDIAQKIYNIYVSDQAVLLPN